MIRKLNELHEITNNIEPIVIPEKDVPSFNSKSDFFDWAADIFKALGTVTIKETGITIILSKSSANRETVKRRSSLFPNRAVFSKFKEVVESAKKLKNRPKDDRHKHNQEVYVNKISIGDDTYIVEIFCDYLEKNKEYRYAGHKTEIAPSSRESSSTLSIGAINIIADESKSVNPQEENKLIQIANELDILCEKIYTTNDRGDKMHEEVTFFKDEKNKNGSRVKNPNRVYAAKKAHKTHGFAYKRAAEKMSCSEIADFLDNEIAEAKVTAENKANMYSEISFEDLTGAFQVQVKENLTDVDIILVAKDNGNGSYKLEGESSDKMETSLIYNTLVNDLKTLADNIDRDFQAILKKNGLVKRVD